MTSTAIITATKSASTAALGQVRVELRKLALKNSWVSAHRSKGDAEILNSKGLVSFGPIEHHTFYVAAPPSFAGSNIALASSAAGRVPQP